MADPTESEIDAALLDTMMQEIEDSGFAGAESVVVDSGAGVSIEPWPTRWRGREMAYAPAIPPESPFDHGGDIILGAGLPHPDYELDSSPIEEQSGGSAPPRPSIEQVAEARDAEEEARRKVVPLVSIVPESAYRGILGRQQTINPLLPPQEVIRWSGDPTEALPVSLAIAPTQPNLAGSSTSESRASGFARIQFGTRGGTNEVDIDIGAGIQLTLPCSVLYVSVGIDPPPGGGTSPTFDLSASLGFYPVVRSTPLTRTSTIYQLAAAGSTTIARPRFAQRLYFVRNNYAAQYTLVFKGAGLDLYTVVVAGSTQMLEPIRLSNVVQRVTVTNTGGSADNSAIIWELAL